MNRFAALYQALDQAAGNRARETALVDYFADAGHAEASWAIHVLSGAKVNAGRHRVATTTELREWVAELAAMPLWLVEDSYRQVGDLAETLALLVSAARGAGTLGMAEAAMTPPGETWFVPDSESSLDAWIERFLIPLSGQPADTRRRAIQSAWLRLDDASRFVFNKLLTGALRVGVSRRTLQISLARLAGIAAADMAHRMVGEWIPSPGSYEALMDLEVSAQSMDKPYPFYLASPLASEPAELGDPAAWQAEWKWDGIRVQLVRRAGHVPYLWSRGEERLDGRFPELEVQAALLPPGVVLDGELLAWDETAGLPRAFVALQKRIQKRQPSARLMRETPVRILFYDVLESRGEDWRGRPLSERRAELERLLAPLLQRPGSLLDISPVLAFDAWPRLAALRETAAEHHAEGLMLKSLGSPYQEGRRRGNWWKWKLDPFSIDAVLIYAQSGSGRRSTLHTDYTFAVWTEEGALVPVAKAYSGLSDAEILRLDKWIRAHTLERFGPVRSVQPQQVFEIGFEAVNRSSRHKSGVAVRFPRILRWREDKTPEQADRLSALLALSRDG
ncbi:ATP-dependent DNA ligase [Diaphorobacter ruginosibacter]|uniref:DNA ligase (ATP) n=1 Tax=Diaphorobacter ruginosibacter TaxID=1715720 RepID=A0A7G9RTR3_9BURK|nr:ATP-dependent DNA ligase [Diaphorobacter ruginosibacter]QNN58988.1 ATP-dependent DNA ligase [Diaphorobacter ruginosibacter]